MIKRILGFLFSVAVVAVIVFAVLRRDRFVSYVDWKRPAPRDSVSVQPEPAADSLRVEQPDSLSVTAEQK